MNAKLEKYQFEIIQNPFSSKDPSFAVCKNYEKFKEYISNNLLNNHAKSIIPLSVAIQNSPYAEFYALSFELTPYIDAFWNHTFITNPATLRISFQSKINKDYFIVIASVGNSNRRVFCEKFGKRFATISFSIGAFCYKNEYDYLTISKMHQNQFSDKKTEFSAPLSLLHKKIIKNISQNISPFQTIIENINIQSNYLKDKYEKLYKNFIEDENLKISLKNLNE